MAGENNDSKWVGKGSTEELRNISAKQLWPFFEDFCSLPKWVPKALDVEKCRHVEGVYGKPGLVRYCAFTEQTSSALSNNADKTPTKWCYEKLLSMDPVERTLSYEVTENNLGFTSYVAEVKIIETDGGCRVDWSFTSDPVEGMRLEDLRGFLLYNMQIIAEEIEKELLISATKEESDSSEKILFEVPSDQSVEQSTETAVQGA